MSDTPLQQATQLLLTTTANAELSLTQAEYSTYLSVARIHIENRINELLGLRREQLTMDDSTTR